MAEDAADAVGLVSAPSASRKPDPRRALILNGSVSRGVLAVALPSVATMLLQTTNGMLDRSFVGRLGPEALAAITVGSSLMFALMSAAMAVSVGTTALVARFVGEGKYDDAVTVVRQSLLLAIVLSLAVGAPMFVFRVPLLAFLGLDTEARTLAARYLAVTVVGLPSLFTMLMLNGAFRGLGDTVRPFYVTLGAIGIHASLNYCLIFGNFGFPRLGLPGGAAALALSQIMATALYVVFLLRTPLRAAVFPRSIEAGGKGGVRGWAVEGEWARRICRIGLPASAQQLIRVGSMLTFQSLLARSGAGSAAVAALGVGLVSESIAFMPGFGYAIAASAFVGQNLGARQVTRANAGAWTATYQAVIVMSLMGVVFYRAAGPFAHFFLPHITHETPRAYRQVESTIRLTVAYLRLAAWSEPFLALSMVLTGALQGAGETVGPTALTIFSMIVLRVPLAYVLLHYTQLGTPGAWLAMSASTVVQGILTVFLFRRGRWRTVRV
jgi:putative MATE family efflux protein